MVRDTENSLPSTDERQIAAVMPGYEAALHQLPTSELMSHLTRINGVLAEQQTRNVTDLLMRKLEHESQPFASSMSEARPSPEPTRRAEQPSRSPQPSALELLASSSRIGPRLASKLILASAQAHRRRNG